MKTNTPGGLRWERGLLAAALTLAAALMAGCSSSGSVGPSPTGAPSAAVPNSGSAGEASAGPSGQPRFVHYVSAGQGFEMDIPATWTQTPDTHLIYGGQTLVGDEFKANTSDGFPANLTVIHRPSPGATPQDVYTQEIATVQAAEPGATVDAMTIAGREGRILQSQDVTFEDRTVDAAHAFVVINGTEWVITYRAPAGQTADKWVELKHMLASFALH